ncbi:MAG: T9SS type A sorting domain-containing protein, partial [Bacteroidetes bacterium]|nr:T9SS type A sorting domain-containing protein [Bacteroidota bacterium]
GAMYRPVGDSISSWSVLEEDTLTFWLKSINNTGYGFQYCHVIVGNNCGGYYKFTASAAVILNPTIGQWKRIDIPLAGGSPWARSIIGNVSFDDLNYVEIHADTWDFGFELWIDGLSFNTLFTRLKEKALQKEMISIIYPNPAVSMATLQFNLIQPGEIKIDILDSQGKVVKSIIDSFRHTGNHLVQIDMGRFRCGLFFCRLITEESVSITPFVISR